MRIKELSESTVAGSIASVVMPLGGTQKRNKPEKAPKVTKGKKYANTLSEGEIKRIATDMDELSDAAFKKKYGKTKQEMRASLKEEKIAEADLIVVPGMRKSKDKSFIPHKEDRRDHEVEMARSDLYAAAKDAMRIFKLLKDRSEDDGIMGWQQSYITLASDYLNSVADSLEYQMNMYEMTGGVLAGGMSNFEEGVAEGTKTGNPVILKGCDFEDVVNWLVKNVGPVTKKSSNYYNGWQGKGWILNLLQSSNEDGIPNLELSADTKLTNNQVLAKTIQMACSNQQGVAEGSLNEFAPDGFFGGDEGGGKGPKAKAKAQMIKAYGPGIITFRKTSNGGYFVQHEDDFGDTNSHQYDPQTGKVDFSGVTRSSYYGEGRYYDPMGDERREQGAMDADRRRFKWDELSQELKGEEERARKYEQGPWYILINGKLVKDKSKNPYTFNTLSGAQKAVKTMREKEWNKDKKFEYTRTPKDSGMTEANAHKCPECGGEMVSEELMNEKKDACYYKVKSRYKVWPSAYASGALVKCRKKGASNWGNKSKK